MFYESSIKSAKDVTENSSSSQLLLVQCFASWLHTLGHVYSQIDCTATDSTNVSSQIRMLNQFEKIFERSFSSLVVQTRYLRRWLSWAAQVVSLLHNPFYTNQMLITFERLGIAMTGPHCDRRDSSVAIRTQSECPFSNNKLARVPRGPCVVTQFFFPDPSIPSARQTYLTTDENEFLARC